MIKSFLPAFLILSCLLFLALSHPYHEDKQAKNEWAKFKSDHGKKYENDTHSRNYTEDLYRFELWYERREALKHHNGTWNVALNHFSDLSEAELKNTYLNLKPNNSTFDPPPIRDFIEKFVKGKQSEPTTPAADSDSGARLLASLPTSIDWRLLGKVTPVKDQGNCGSCWTFSTVGAIESLRLIVNSSATNSTANYSEQQLVNCDSWNGACNGGDPVRAMNWEYFNGTTSATTYPYTSGKGSWTSGDSKCSSLPKAFQTFGANLVKRYNTTDLMVAVNMQPVVVSVYADYMFSYSSGLFNNCSNSSQNHAVLLVGYTSDSWIIKNSWGTGWGEKGFIRLNKTNPLCGAMISAYASYPQRTKRTTNLDPYCSYYPTSYCTDRGYMPYMISCFFV